MANVGQPSSAGVFKSLQLDSLNSWYPGGFPSRERAAVCAARQLDRTIDLRIAQRITGMDYTTFMTRPCLITRPYTIT